MNKKVTDESIIEIIRKMVAEGEPEEKIVQQLKDLGVEPDKAKRLVLLGQADTFALLRGEIVKIVNAELEKQKPAMLSYLNEESKKISKKMEEDITKAVIRDVKQYEEELMGQSKHFQDQINDNVKKLSELSDRVRDKLNELGVAVKQVQVDLDELKLKGVSTRNRFVTFLLLFFGIAFCVADFYFFYSLISSDITVDGIILTVVFAMIGITMLFVSTIL
ncbi:MAG: hypothetical protein N3D73_01755 [Candidatus Diapherotrites archaeon]|nr:hypothetical protein [Candidatus Diapherotrites archaeon]